MVKKLQTNNYKTQTLGESSSSASHEQLKNELDKLKASVNKLKQSQEEHKEELDSYQQDQSVGCRVHSAVVQTAHTNSVLVAAFSEQTIKPAYQRWEYYEDGDEYRPIFTEDSSSANAQLVDYNTGVNLGDDDENVEFTAKLGYNFQNNTDFPTLNDGVKKSHTQILNRDGVNEVSLGFMSSLLSKNHISHMPSIDESTGEFVYQKPENNATKQEQTGCCNGKKRRQKCSTSSVGSKPIPECEGTLFRYTETGCHMDSLNWIPLDEWITSERIDDHFRYEHKRDAYAYMISNAALVKGYDECHNRTELVILLEVRNRNIKYNKDNAGFLGTAGNINPLSDGVEIVSSGARPYFINPRNQPRRLDTGVPDEFLPVPPRGEAGNVVGIVPLGIENAFITNSGFFNEVMGSKLRYRVLHSHSPFSAKSPLLHEYFSRSNGPAHLKIYKAAKYGSDCEGEAELVTVSEFKTACGEDCDESNFVDKIVSVKANKLNTRDKHELGLKCGAIVQVDKSRIITDGVTYFVKAHNIHELDDGVFGSFQITNKESDTKLGNHHVQGADGGQLHDFRKCSREEEYYIPLSTCGSSPYLLTVPTCDDQNVSPNTKPKYKTAKLFVGSGGLEESNTGVTRRQH